MKVLMEILMEIMKMRNKWNWQQVRNEAENERKRKNNVARVKMKKNIVFSFAK